MNSYIEHKKEIKKYKKNEEELKERIIQKNFKLEEIKRENKNLKKELKRLLQENESYKKEVEMLYQTIDELSEINN